METASRQWEACDSHATHPTVMLDEGMYGLAFICEKERVVFFRSRRVWSVGVGDGKSNP
jgi:hypothetical protein